MNPKCVVVTDRDGSNIVIMFPAFYSHKCFAAENVVSAGFFHIGTAGVVCYGESESLKVKSRKEDATQIGQFKKY